MAINDFTPTDASEAPLLELLDHPLALIKFLGHDLALVRFKAHCVVNDETLKAIHSSIFERLHCDYFIIEDRVETYSINPISAYECYNGLDHLKAIAILPGNNCIKGLIEIETALSQKPINFFVDAEAAVSWLTELPLS